MMIVFRLSRVKRIPAFKERSDPDQILLAGPRLGREVSEPRVEVRSLDLYEALVRGDA